MRKEEMPEIIENNRKLIENFPFLLPRNADGSVPADYDYSYTEADGFPAGWWKAFGEEMMEDLKEELERVDFLEQFRILDVKEKYGTLRFYSWMGSKPSKVGEIIEHYGHISEHTCIICGAVDVPVIDDGWISPYCRPCYMRRQEERAKTRGIVGKTDLNAFNCCIEDASPLAPVYQVRAYRGEKQAYVQTKHDVSDILKRMQKRNPELFIRPWDDALRLKPEIFDEDGNVKACGRAKCTEMIKTLEQTFPGEIFGDVEFGRMDIPAVQQGLRILEEEREMRREKEREKKEKEKKEEGKTEE